METKYEPVTNQLADEVNRRRTFAIISHPDAGKTTLTEKLLLFGGAIRLAGTVKGRKASKYATSDWMEIEKQRGISVTSSVLQFRYRNFCINLLDTPGHQDFSEDTYRTLTAADSAVMLVDAAKGVEPQTIKLFKVCRMRKIPIFTFINKLDRETRDPFELLDEISDILGIATYPMNWPVGAGQLFRGIYDRRTHDFEQFDRNQSGRFLSHRMDSFDDEKWNSLLTPDELAQLREETELLDGAGQPFSLEEVINGELTPVFFGSAVANFGVQPFLDWFLEMSTPPSSRETMAGTIQPTDAQFTGYVFKIQANMNPAHRDRIAFLRICSGHFRRGMMVRHSRTGKSVQLSQPQQFLAQDREIVEEGYAGDIIGLHDPGTFRIGDSLSESGHIQFVGIPQFSPEHFARIELKDTMKYKQFQKGIAELIEEGVIQQFRPLYQSNDIILGVVGPLQFEVLAHRLTVEYGVQVNTVTLPYSLARWVKDPTPEVFAKLRIHDCLVVIDQQEWHVVLCKNEWVMRRIVEQIDEVEFLETRPL